MLEDETPRSFDGTFGFPMRYGLGMMKGGDRFSLFGMHTRKAFGHLGFSNVLVYSDPERQLSVAFLNTGKPMLAPGMVPWAMLVQRLAAMVPREKG
jgi:CubicO group peptidase (beta-lactamase class C family)